MDEKHLCLNPIKYLFCCSVLKFCPVHISKAILAMAMKFRGWLQLGVRRAYLATICRSCFNSIISMLFCQPNISHVFCQSYVSLLF